MGFTRRCFTSGKVFFERGASAFVSKQNQAEKQLAQKVALRSEVEPEARCCPNYWKSAKKKSPDGCWVDQPIEIRWLILLPIGKTRADVASRRCSPGYVRVNTIGGKPGGQPNIHNDSGSWTGKKQPLLYALQHPDVGYRRLTYMMLDADVVAVSQSSTYRVLKCAFCHWPKVLKKRQRI